MNVNNDELEEFRSNWIREVRQRAPQSAPEQVEETEIAMEHFILAADFERNGSMNEAMKHYRIATKLDPDIENKHWKMMSQKIQMELLEPFENLTVNEDEEDEEEEETMQVAVVAEEEINEEEEMEESIFLQIPYEILVLIIKRALQFDIYNYMKLSLTCSWMRETLKDQSIWRHLCISHHFDHSPSTLTGQLSLYRDSWYNMWIKKPRVRYDGCYISRVSYVRRGMSETLSLTHVVHLVTYFRYLRFYPNNHFVLLTSFSEPMEVVQVCSFNSRVSMTNRK
ncbi:hypothetical protein HK103_002631 [Boothiomyces macroporosus]|uniref:F-box domain-containing protein n=1 Tax=Boothiomyces macroporosus TaxID=261099 RepID=A0AAD5UMD4_9FUNG|nr:hypothetical protein HK103_002631 [Boothiomyces macroporosus]